MKPILSRIHVGRNLFLASLWIGTFLAIAGISTYAITSIWSNLAVLLLISGMLLIATVLLLRWRFGPPSKNQVSWWRRRSTQAGTNALIATLAVIIMLGVLNFMAVRYGQQVDLTETQLFSLAPQTQEVLRQLPQPLKVWSFTQPPIPAERTLLEKFAQVNPEQFQFEFVDPQLQPGLAQKFKVFSSDKVVLEYGDRSKTIDSPVTESQITPVMVSLLGNVQANIYFVEGHGEVPLAGAEINLQSASTALNQKDFSLSPLNLVQSTKIPEDADVLVIAGPKRDFVKSELELIKNYLKQGGNLLALMDPEFKTGLGPIFKEWGITLDNRIIVDASSSGQFLGLGPAVPLVVSYGSHPISQDFDEGFSYFPLAQSLKVDESKSSEITPILVSQERTWAEANPDSEELDFDPKVDLQGPLTIGVALDSHQVPEKSELDEEKESPPAKPKSIDKPRTKIVVIGDSDFATSGPFEQGLNGDVFLNSVSWLADENLNLSIRPKAKVERRLDISGTRLRVLALTAIAFLPLLAFSIAGTIWWKRR
ncbi:MAG: ABC transporter [Acaryochloridaceae cyanobacterium RL_2_7]|nr:ABC transporter [Acaryochloridaceae cyanobacterium RL_2_7]